VNLSGASGGIAQAEEMLAEAMTARLAQDGLSVEPGRPAVFHVRTAMTEADRLLIYERQLLPGYHSAVAKLERADEGSLIVELQLPGHREPVWRGECPTGLSAILKTQDSDPEERERLVERAKRELGALAIPYFIPRSDTLPALPAIIE
jgi:hypothetical protein